MTSQNYHASFSAGAVSQSHTIELPGTDDELLTLTCRWPADVPPKAFVVFCHGLGASGSQYEELSRYWASHGYFVVHPTFPDSVKSVLAAQPELGIDPELEDLTKWTSIPNLRPRMFEILHTPFYWMERIRIVGHVLDGLGEISTSLCGQDFDQLPRAISGHSFGAYTSQLFAGAEIDVPGVGVSNFRDERFKAAILLSAQGRDQQGLREGSWDPMTGPVLNVTGTLDRGAKNQDWEWKSVPYNLAPPNGKYLAVFENADHYLGGMTLTDPKAGLPEQRDAVAQLTLAFLDAHVMEDEAARSWLASITDHIGSCQLLFRRK